MREAKSNPINEFRLHDFYQAVILRAVGFPLLRLERGRDKTIEFIFEDTGSTAREVLASYWNRELIIPARDLVDTVNEFKTRIHSRA